MEFRQLEAFAAVAETKSFSKAAEDLFLSQSTISSHIKNLEKELSLTQYFLDGLEQIKENKKILLIGKKGIEDRAPVISLQIADTELSQAAFLLDSKYQIQTRVGLHCAPSAHKTLGTFPTGTLRFSFGHTNTTDEIDACLQALEEICHGI